MRYSSVLKVSLKNPSEIRAGDKRHRKYGGKNTGVRSSMEIREQNTGMRRGGEIQGGGAKMQVWGEE